MNKNNKIVTTALLILIVSGFTVTTATAATDTNEKTYTDINEQYDWPMPVSTAIGIILAVIGMYLCLVAVLKQDFMRD